MRFLDYSACEILFRTCLSKEENRNGIERFQHVWGILVVLLAEFRLGNQASKFTIVSGCGTGQTSLKNRPISLVCVPRHRMRRSIEG